MDNAAPITVESAIEQGLEGGWVLVKKYSWEDEAITFATNTVLSFGNSCSTQRQLKWAAWFATENEAKEYRKEVFEPQLRTMKLKKATQLAKYRDIGHFEGQRDFR